MVPQGQGSYQEGLWFVMFDDFGMYALLMAGFIVNIY